MKKKSETWLEIGKKTKMIAALEFVLKDEKSTLSDYAKEIIEKALSPYIR